jgi:CubicO group peptidase (beta-lactamase class C family)
MKLRNAASLTALVFCLLISVTAQTDPPGSVPSTQTLSAKSLSAALEDYFQKAAGLGFSGAVLVEKDGNVLLRKGYGWADVKRRIPIAPDSIFDIGSGVKAFTATAIMQLEERGKLNTSDLMSKYISNVPSDKKDITIHQLLTHTSGLNFDYFYDQATPAEREIMRDRENYIKGVLGYPLAFKPGEGRTYSNTGFSLLAVVIENVSGEPYQQYVREHLFKPAGMTETGYYLPRDTRRIARGYNDGDTDYGYPWETQWDGKRPLWDLMGNGGMLTTVDDVHKWLVAIKGNKIISLKTKNKMLEVYHAKSGQAYGWDAGQTQGKPYVGRAGDAVPQAWNVEFRWYKDDDLIAVVLANKRVRAGSIRHYAMPRLVDITLFGKPPQIPAFSAVNPTNLRSLEGAYKLESGALFHVKLSEAATGDVNPKPVLIISGEGQEAIDLLFSANQLPGLTKLEADLSDKTKPFIEALRRNDTNALKVILPEGSSPEEAVKRWNDFVKQNGELERFEVLGTSPLNQSGVQTFVRLNFQKTVGVYKVTWRDQKLHEQEEDRLQPAITVFLRKSFVAFPLSLSFLPQSETDFATYDLFKGRTVNVTFDQDKLVVHTKNGDVLAKKAIKSN